MAFATIMCLLLPQAGSVFTKELIQTFSVVGFLLIRAVFIDLTTSELDPWYALIPAGVFLLKSGFGWNFLNLFFLVVQIIVLLVYADHDVAEMGVLGAVIYAIGIVLLCLYASLRIDRSYQTAAFINLALIV